MFFGSIPVDEAEGAILAHAVRAGELVMKKGRVLTLADCAALRAQGFATIVGARIGPEDVGEDDAAHRAAALLAGEGVRCDQPATGRVNLFAQNAGLLIVDGARVDAFNAVDEAITFATLPSMKPVEAGEMIATTKIIPFAVPQELLARAMQAAAGAAVTVKPFRAKRVAVISTLLPGLKPSVVAKTVDVLGKRLAKSGSAILTHVQCAHDEAHLGEALMEVAAVRPDLVIVFGASAITDRRDVIPAAIDAKGGDVLQFGMPVDPGNLLMIATLNGINVLGAPGCARSPAENGFDWVLDRLLADVPVTSQDLRRMGVGGLLMEIVQRGHPRVGGEA